MRKLILFAVAFAAPLAGGAAYAEITSPAHWVYVCQSTPRANAGRPAVGVIQIVDEPGHRVQLCTKRTLAQRAAAAVGL